VALLILCTACTAGISTVYAQTGTQTIRTFAGNGSAGSSAEDIPATSAPLGFPVGIAVDETRGRVYFADQNNHRVRVVTIDGTISTFAGTGAVCQVPTSPCGDNGPAKSAPLSLPVSLAVDSSGDVYIGELNTVRIRKVAIATGIITTVAGTGNPGDGPDGPATSASLRMPFGLAVDAAKNLYIAESDNHRVRKLTNGVLRTFAGNGTAGPIVNGVAATATTLSYPTDVAVDAAGNVYIADENQKAVRRVDAATGLISTVAGGGTGNPENIAATAAALPNVTGIALDASGNLYIADAVTHRIRRVTAATGIISTFAGTGVKGYSGDGAAPTAAQLAFPTRIAFGGGSTFISDSDNNRIRQIIYSSTVPTITSLTPDSGTAGSSINVSFAGTNFQGAYSVSGGPGITFSNVAISTTTIVRATFNLGASAPSGPHAVTIRTLAGTSNALTFTVLPLGAPSFSASVAGAPSGVIDPRQQPAFSFSLASPYTAAVTGTLKITAADPNVQFASGGQTAPFTVPANQTQAVFANNASTMQFSTGTLAGEIVFTASLAMAAETFASDVAVSRLTVSDKPPTITTVSASQSTGALVVKITGFSTSKQITQATFTFAGQNVDTRPVDVDVSPTFTQWYGTPESRLYGSMFTLTVPFTATGGSIPPGTVTVTLKRGQDSSAAMSASY